MAAQRRRAQEQAAQRRRAQGRRQKRPELAVQKTSPGAGTPTKKSSEQALQRTAQRQRQKNQQVIRLQSKHFKQVLTNKREDNRFVR